MFLRHLTEEKSITMNITATERRLPKKTEVSSAMFWDFSLQRDALNESERLVQIKAGFPAVLGRAMSQTFGISEEIIAGVLGLSLSTFERRMRDKKALDTVASERLDRIAAISHQAEETFGSREVAAQWMARPNQALGNATPIVLCETEIGAMQVRRVLNALEWGGVA